ncbi:outer membrane lipoprotein chaperone LolA [Blochmannia endosymbiont of Camponotus sp.]|uniref:outer membrane lipoprotein chaperone LolA n=1 Tax=Blochmannia endosymbiont of Camponotus sp. TaxID=700220 RepID=UPI002024EB0C|nr:outer membrane lipoprotein chaperone LolA [Blochmannia endosymbiont of Camponotus sp.]URJ31102.1 outer membrane lipoprotein chaperone LolA [Blochmannia endosymbiont of Camponotus sp.]
MINQVIYAVFLSIIIMMPAISDDTSVITLRNRLKKINDFYARFTQKVISANNDILLEAYGELWVKRPNLFHWHMISPEENFLISDGKTLWFYIPFIKQVTAYWLQNFSDNIFFMLFSDNNAYKWDNYNVIQQGEFFYLIPIRDNCNLQEFRVKITDCGTIEQFSVFEKKDQYVDYYLLDQNNNTIDIKKFYFDVSKDIQLDEQRE